MRPGRAEPVLIPLPRIGSHRHDRDGSKPRIAFQRYDEIKTTDMGQVDVGDDKVRPELQRLRHHIAAVTQWQHFMTMGAQQVAKKFEIEFVVLDNEHALCHQSPALNECAFEKRADTTAPCRESIMRSDSPDSKRLGPADNEDAMTLALMALAWTLSDEQRADRLLALTGLDASALRAGVDDKTVLQAVLDFLADHEPDLIACADALDTTAEGLIGARRELGR